MIPILLLTAQLNISLYTHGSTGSVKFTADARTDLSISITAEWDETGYEPYTYGIVFIVDENSTFKFYLITKLFNGERIDYSFVLHYGMVPGNRYTVSWHVFDYFVNPLKVKGWIRDESDTAEDGIVRK